MLSNIAAFAAISLLLPWSSLGCDNATQWSCLHTEQCVSMESRCDGVADCRDGGSDENNCNYLYKCEPGEFNCNDGDCIPASFKCDGNPDCHNGRDEKGCDGIFDEDSDASKPKSSLSTSRKISGSLTPSDGCDGNMYHCKQGKCIHPAFVCDGEPDCPLGDDEMNCPSGPRTRCVPNQKKCKTTEACIPNNWFCDGEFDCDDNSDEEDCPDLPIDEVLKADLRNREKDRSALKENQPANTTLAPTQLRATCTKDEYRCRRGQCIDVAKLCDGIRDCADGDDEGGSCGDCENMNCVYGCKATNKEAFCTCPEKMIVNPDDYLDCVLDNPCMHHTHCSHFCKPRPDNSYYCTCDIGFALDSDQHRCIPQHDPFGGDLLFSVGNEIRVSSLHGDSTHPSKYRIYSALDTGENLFHLAIDVKNNKLWAGIASHTNEWRIAMSNNGEILSGRRGFAELGNMQYDWINRNLYFITGGRSEIPAIRVCTENLMYCSKLIQGKRTQEIQGRKHIQAFRGLALHPLRGLMCWIEVFNGQSKVKCANMDGSNIEVLLDHKLVNPVALVWDTLKNDLYVADAGNELIERINYDTKEQRVIGRVDSPYALAFFNGILYYSEMELNVIRSIDVSTDHHLMPHIERSLPHRPFGLAINHTLAQNGQAVASCPANLDCNYVCVTLPRGDSLHSCLCPEGYERNEQDKTCSFPRNNNFQSSSYLDVNYMDELCKNGVACGSNGECLSIADEETNEIEAITCQCNVGYLGIACELADGKAVARALEGQETSFVTIILLFIVFLIILAIAFFCIHEKHQPFRDFTKSTKEAVMDSSPRVFRAVQAGLRQASQKVSNVFATGTPRRNPDSAPCTASFASPMFQEAAEKPRNDLETGSPLVNKTPDAKLVSPCMVSPTPAPPVPTGVKMVFENFENPAFNEPVQVHPLETPRSVSAIGSWELSSYHDIDEPTFHLGEYQDKNIY